MLRSCPSGYNGTVTFACNDNILTLNSGKCGERCSAGTYLLDQSALDYPEARRYPLSHPHGRLERSIKGLLDQHPAGLFFFFIFCLIALFNSIWSLSACLLLNLNHVDLMISKTGDWWMIFKGMHAQLHLLYPFLGRSFWSFHISLRIWMIEKNWPWNVLHPWPVQWNSGSPDPSSSQGCGEGMGIG